MELRLQVLEKIFIVLATTLPLQRGFGEVMVQLGPEMNYYNFVAL